MGNATSLGHTSEVGQVLNYFRAFWHYLTNMSGRWTKGSSCYKTHP